MWARWRRGEALRTIARRFGRDLIYVRRFLMHTGGRRAALVLDGASGLGAHAEARRVVRAAFGLDPDAVPHDLPPGWPFDT